MSKVDTTDIKSFLASLGLELTPESLFALAAGEDMDLSPDIEYPERGTRDWNDPEYQAEYRQYTLDKKSAAELVCAKWDYEGNVDQDGGGEGGAEYCYSVFRLLGKLYKIDYAYYSHSGYEYEDCITTLREVKPVEKTITVYE